MRKSTRDGRTVSITYDGGPLLARWEDTGQRITRGRLERAERPPAPHLTHQIGRVKVVYLTEAEAGEVQAEWERGEAEREQAQAEWEATPEGAREKLRSRRRELGEAHSGAAYNLIAADRRAHEEDRYVPYGVHSRPALEAALREAERACDEFDAEHPEIIEEMRREREEDLRRACDNQ